MPKPQIFSIQNFKSAALKNKKNKKPVIKCNCRTVENRDLIHGY